MTKKKKPVVLVEFTPERKAKIIDYLDRQEKEGIMIDMVMQERQTHKSVIGVFARSQKARSAI